MKQSEKMYGNAPKLERDEQDGKVKDRWTGKRTKSSQTISKTKKIGLVR